MSVRLPFMKTLSAALVFASLGASAAQAQAFSANGAEMLRGQNCALQYMDRSLTGGLLVKAEAGFSGSYRVIVRRHNDRNDVLVNMSGRFRSDPSSETVIARAFLASRDIMEARRSQSVRQGRQVYAIDGYLALYDAHGRETCRTSQIDVLRLTPRAAPSASAQPGRTSNRASFTPRTRW